VIEELEGKDVNKIIAAGSKKLAKFGGGGGAFQTWTGSEN